MRARNLQSLAAADRGMTTKVYYADPIHAAIHFYDPRARLCARTSLTRVLYRFSNVVSYRVLTQPVSNPLGCRP